MCDLFGVLEVLSPWLESEDGLFRIDHQEAQIISKHLKVKKKNMKTLDMKPVLNEYFERLN